MHIVCIHALVFILASTKVKEMLISLTLMVLQYRRLQEMDRHVQFIARFHWKMHMFKTGKTILGRKAMGTKTYT